MTAPKWATTTETGRCYENPLRPGSKYTSVTTVIGTLDKGDAIPGWAAKCTSEALENVYGSLDPGGILRVSDFRDAKGAWKDIRAEAGRKGDLVHTYIEHWFRAPELGLTAPDPPHDVKGHVVQFHKWLAGHDIVPLFIEPTVYSDEYGYAGSCDMIAEIDGVVTAVDWKTSKTLSPTVALQLAAYANGDYLVTDDGESHPMPLIKRGAALHVRPRSHKFVEVNIGLTVFNVFCELLNVRHEWIDDLSTRALCNTIPAKENA